ncbi:MAG: MaoC family dehydratase [Candidatus Dormibacteraeota bacterium]|nr:MaoC family dehydratase [Candidatus Dormibacteraeota bacterium]
MAGSAGWAQAPDPVAPPLERRIQLSAADEHSLPTGGEFGPQVDLFFEDFHPGQRFELGEYRITEAEMLDFARRFDPQPFHIDPVQASATIFKGLIASGWQTAAIWMRLYCDGLLLRAAILGSPGIEELRWLSPVRPGDLLRASVEVISGRPSVRHPERGTLVMRGELRGESGQLKMRLTAWGLIAHRPPAGS